MCLWTCAVYTRIVLHFKHEKPVVRRRHHVLLDGLRRAHLYDMLIIMRRRGENRLHNNVGHRLQPVVRRRHHVLLDGLRRDLLYEMFVMRRSGENRLHNNVQHRVPRVMRCGQNVLHVGQRPVHHMLIIMRRRCENHLHSNVQHRLPTRVRRRHHVLLDGLRPMLTLHSGLNMRGGRRDEHLYQNGEHRVQFDNIVPRRQRLYTRLLDDCGDLSLVYARHVFQHQRRHRLQGEDSLLVPRG